eukprot:1537963-Rhodomonas_salina.1
MLGISGISGHDHAGPVATPRVARGAHSSPQCAAAVGGGQQRAASGSGARQARSGAEAAGA